MKKVTSSLDFTFQKLAAGMPDDLSLTQGSRKLEARKWLRDSALAINNIDAQRFTNRADKSRLVNRIDHDHIGQMFMFWYDAKLKEELPFWDRLPLIYPIEIYKDGFLGINLHYLSPMFRARLMDALYSTISDQKYNKNTHLRIRYQILKGATRFRYFKPCIKRYLHSHVQSRFIRIEPTEWDMALMLPTERFQKKRKQVVWNDSVIRLGSRDD